MSEQPRERDSGGGDPEAGGRAEGRTQVWPSPGAMVGITIPEELDASPTDDAQSGPGGAPQEPERDEDDAPQ